MIRIATEASTEAYKEDPDNDAASHIEMLSEGLYQLSDEGSSGGDPVHISVALEGALTMAQTAMDSDGEIVGIGSGLADLDSILGGFKDTDLYILAARPGMGKSALAMNIARHAAEHYGPTAFFSLEMSSEQLAQRLQSDESSINSHDINRGKITENDMRRLTEASQTIGAIPLYIDDKPAITTNQLRSRARRLQRKHGVKFIIVDYLQLLQAVGVGKDSNNVTKVTAISGALKALAKELGVPVLALSQLSRQVENRDDKRPQLADLRESGAIEQDADAVAFIYREEYYLERKKPERKENESEQKLAERMADYQDRLDAVMNLAEIIVAKNRHGPIGDCLAFFDGPTCRFKNVVKQDRKSW